MTSEQHIHRAGLLYGLGAYFLWGFLPLYFKLLTHVSPVEIVAHRILWSLVFLALLVSLWRRWPAIRAALASGRVLMTLLATSLLIGVNWLIYIWAVMNDHVLEGSLGYYLNPLINVLLGVVLLKERLNRAQLAAILLAGTGVSVLAIGAAGGLWISLLLALSFGLYGFVRKVASVNALEGLSLETAILAPLSLGFVLWLQSWGESGFGAFGLGTDVLIALGGVVTAVPLLLFTAAARRLPYSTLGFLQYIAPSIQFLLAVLAFGEPLTSAHIICFAAIWTALAIFAADGVRRGRAARARAEAETACCP